jgi:hypothetical protein
MPPHRRRRPGGPARAVPFESRGSDSVGPGSRASGWYGASTPAGQPASSLAPGSISRVLIDGRNVQHALARDTGSSLPTAALVARLRAAFSPPTEVELILDGHAGRSPQGRMAPGLTVVFTKGATADQVIGVRVSEAFRALGPADSWSVVVVTDDREVRANARHNGVRVEGTAWLGDKLRVGAAAGVGLPRAPRMPRAPRPRTDAPRGSSG